MRPAHLALIALVLAAPPTLARADDDAAIQALIGKLKPRSANERIVVRGLPASGHTGATAADTAAPSLVAPAPVAPAAAPHRNATTVAATSLPATTTAAATPVERPSADLNVQFATGSAMLTPTAVSQLQILGKALSDPSMAQSRFLVEGHTDTVGDRMVNKVLSERRAQAVAEFLNQKFHITPDRLETAGKGAEDLLVPTADQTPELRNRRVHIVNLNG